MKQQVPASKTFMQMWLAGSSSAGSHNEATFHSNDSGRERNFVQRASLSSSNVNSTTAALKDGSCKENVASRWTNAPKNRSSTTSEKSDSKSTRPGAGSWESAHSEVKPAPPVARKLVGKRPPPTTIDLTESDNEDDGCTPPLKRREIVFSQEDKKRPSTGRVETNDTAMTIRGIARSPEHAPKQEPVASATESFAHLPLTEAVYDLRTFKEMWKQVEIDIGAPIEFFESQKGVRRANSKLDKNDTSAQDKAQYGRIFCDATQDLFEQHLKLDPNHDVYLDVGHGIGNTVLQAAYVCQCEARGIEVVEDRNAVAIALQSSMEDVRTNLHRERDGINYHVGEVTFRRGSLEATENRDFLTKAPPGKVIKAFCNNYNAVFSDRSAKAKEKYYLDDYLAGLFAMMPPGSVLITLHPLNLVPGRSETQQQREKHGLVCGNNKLNASFYELEVEELGAARSSVTWAQSSTKALTLYKYTRLEQEAGVNKEAVFQCSNPSCERAHSGEAIRATKFVNMVYYSKEEQGVVMNTCDCSQAGTMSLRRRNKVVNYKVEDDESGL